MEKCKYWEFKQELIAIKENYNIYKDIQICNGTKEREECSCNGNPEKCNFYPEKRKENKTMNTAEMYLQAKEDGKFYKTCSTRGDPIFYQKDRGLIDEDECLVSIQEWDCFDDLIEETWELCNNIMTRAEAERALGVKIVD